MMTFKLHDTTQLELYRTNVEISMANKVNSGYLIKSKVRPHFIFDGLSYTWENFKVRRWEKIKIKIEPEPKLCKIVSLLHLLFPSNTSQSGWK